MSQVDGNRYAEVLAIGLFVNVTFTIGIIGMQLFMCLYGLATFLESPRAQKKGKYLYVTLSWVILVLFSMTSILDLYTNFKALWDTPPTSPVDYLDIQFTFDGKWFRTLSIFCLFFSIFVGDGLLLYRCYIVWKDKWFVLVLPLLCYVASIVLGLLIAVPSPNWSLQMRAISSAFTVLTVCVNVMVTGLLSFRLLRARSAMASVLPQQHLKVYERVVTILIESALPPTIFGIGYASSLLLPLTTTQEYVTQAITSTFFSMTYFAFATLSPQLIIFRVTIGRSFMNSTEVGSTLGFSNSSTSPSSRTAPNSQSKFGGNTMGSMKFASQPQTESFLNFESQLDSRGEKAGAGASQRRASSDEYLRDGGAFKAV